MKERLVIDKGREAFEVAGELECVRESGGCWEGDEGEGREGTI